MPILKPNLSKAEKEYIARECHRILDEYEHDEVITSIGLCAHSRYDKTLRISLSDLFENVIPFNEGETIIHRLDAYDAECAAENVFKNKKRMSFLRRWAKKHNPTS